MRFRIEQRYWSRCTGYRLLLPDSVIPLEAPPFAKALFSKENCYWTWYDGVRYSLCCPVFRAGRVPIWEIKSGDDVICCGRLVHPTWRDWLRFKFPWIEWNYDGRVLVRERIGCTGMVLRQHEGRRLAAWRLPKGFGRPPLEGVLRRHLRPQAAAVVFGIILETVIEYND